VKVHIECVCAPADSRAVQQLHQNPELFMPIPVAAQSKASVCGRVLAGIVGSNPNGGMVVCLLGSVWVVR
jgi:hypothetical protein